MDDKELFDELKENGHRFVWYLCEPGLVHPDGISPDTQFIVDLNGKELARRLNIYEQPEDGWRIDAWHARDFGGAAGRCSEGGFASAVNPAPYRRNGFDVFAALFPVRRTVIIMVGGISRQFKEAKVWECLIRSDSGTGCRTE